MSIIKAQIWLCQLGIEWFIMNSALWLYPLLERLIQWYTLRRAIHFTFTVVATLTKCSMISLYLIWTLTLGIFLLWEENSQPQELAILAQSLTKSSFAYLVVEIWKQYSMTLSSLILTRAHGSEWDLSEISPPSDAVTQLLPFMLLRSLFLGEAMQMEIYSQISTVCKSVKWSL